jgi:hypothetical protein
MVSCAALVARTDAPGLQSAPRRCRDDIGCSSTRLRGGEHEPFTSAPKARSASSCPSLGQCSAHAARDSNVPCSFSFRSDRQRARSFSLRKRRRPRKGDAGESSEGMAPRSTPDPRRRTNADRGDTPARRRISRLADVPARRTNVAEIGSAVAAQRSVELVLRLAETNRCPAGAKTRVTTSDGISRCCPSALDDKRRRVGPPRDVAGAHRAARPGGIDETLGSPSDLPKEGTSDRSPTPGFFTEPGALRSRSARKRVQSSARTARQLARMTGCQKLGRTTGYR